MIRFRRGRKSCRGGLDPRLPVPHLVELTHFSLGLAQKCKCWICDKEMVMPDDPDYLRKSRTGASLDHIYPRAQSKRDDPYATMEVKQERARNGVLYACKLCNSTRGDTMPTDEQRLKVRYIMIAAVAFELAKYIEYSPYWK